MLYYLFNYLEQQYALPGASLFGFLSFRAALSVIFSLLLTTIFGKRIISFLQSKQVGESIRDLGLDGQKEKAGTRKNQKQQYEKWSSHTLNVLIRIEHDS